jgi:hypothetical protein
MPKSKKAALSAKETVRAIARLFDLYGIDRSLNRDRSRDGLRYQWALYCAVRDGLLRLPSKPGGGTPKWVAAPGLELIEAIESLRAQPIIPKDKVARQRAIEALRAGKKPRLKSLSIPKAIKALREQYPDKWGTFTTDHLEKRFYEARKFWSYGRRIAMFADPWHEDHPETS